MPSWRATVGIAPMTGAANRSHSLRWVCAYLRDHCPWTGRRSGGQVVRASSGSRAKTRTWNLPVNRRPVIAGDYGCLRCCQPVWPAWGLPWANTAILAGVPPGAGQYRFVRVIPVLIFPGARSCVGFVLPAKRQVIPRSRAPVLNLPCPRGLTAPTAPAPPCCPPAARRPGGCWWTATYTTSATTRTTRPGRKGRWASMNGVRRPGAKRSPARWRRYDTWREAQDTPGVWAADRHRCAL